MPGGLIIPMIISPVMDAAIVIVFSAANKFIMVSPYKTSFTVCQRDLLNLFNFLLWPRIALPDLLEICRSVL